MINLCSLTIVGLVFSNSAFWGLPSDGATPAAATSPTSPAAVVDQSQTDPSADAIARAENPSAAVEAYARAIAAQPGSTRIESAYMNRMVDLGVPAMAEAQSQDLILRDPGNGRAWAVAAYVNGRRGSTDAALGQIETASKRAPDDAFVQHTAGQLLAYFDSHPDASPQPPDAVFRDLPQLRDAMAGKETFESSYQNAREAYRADDQDALAATNPNGSPDATQPASRSSAPSSDQSTPASRVDDSIIANDVIAPSYPLTYVEPYYVEPPYGSYSYGPTYRRYGYAGYAYGSYWPYWCGYDAPTVIVYGGRYGHHDGHDAWRRDGWRSDRGRDGRFRNADGRDGDGRGWRDRSESAVLVPGANGSRNGNRARSPGGNSATATGGSANAPATSSRRIAPFVPSRPAAGASSGTSTASRSGGASSGGASSGGAANGGASSGGAANGGTGAATGASSGPSSGAAAGAGHAPQAQPSAPGPQQPQARPAPGPQRPAAGSGSNRGGSNSSGGRGSSGGGKGGRGR